MGTCMYKWNATQWNTLGKFPIRAFKIDRTHLEWLGGLVRGLHIPYQTVQSGIEEIFFPLNKQCNN